jgi:hypothetical protein
LPGPQGRDRPRVSFDPPNPKWQSRSNTRCDIVVRDFFHHRVARA